MQLQKITPNRWSYLLLKSGTLTLLFPILIILTGISQLSSILSESWVWWDSLLFVIAMIVFVVFGIIFALTYISYRKEQYIFEPTKIIYNSGTLFSDNSTEVRIDKITEVSVILPFWQYLIFKTGYVAIDTAGSSTSKIYLKYVDNPLEIYEWVQELMRQNGYHLAKDTLVQEARPHILGILWELVNRAFGTVLVVLYVFYPILFSDISEDMNYSEISWAINLGFITSIVGGIFILGILAYVIIAYLDLRRRKYEVYTDGIYYTEWFLTRHYSLLPMERVADIENRQSFLSRILGLHDLVVSSEWSNNMVVFKNMTEGEQMIKNIKYLKSQITMQPRSTPMIDDVAGEVSTTTEDLVGYTDTVEAAPQYNSEFRAIYKMYPLKVFLWSIIFIIIAILLGTVAWGEFAMILITITLFSSIGTIIQYFFTDYIIDTSTIEKKFHFLSKKHSSFTVDKVSGVVIRESLLDRMIGSCSVVFWSIGSGTNITFANIRHTPTLEQDILEKIGIYKNTSEKKILEARFNLIEYMKHSIFGAWFFILFIVGIIVVSVLVDTSGTMSDVPFSLTAGGTSIALILVILVVIQYLYNKLYYSSTWYEQSLYQDFVESISGIIFRSKKYSLYRHIKWLSATKNPLTSVGNVSLSVAGQVMPAMQWQNANSILLTRSGYFENSIWFDYMADSFALLDRLDSVLKWDAIDTAEVATSTQDVGNSIIIPVVLTVIAVFFGFSAVGPALAIPLLIWAAIIIGLIVWYVSTKRYILERDRVISEYGIIYRVRQTILYKKFNFIEKYQGFFGKIFKNGVLSIYTLWSSSRDMVLSDVDKFTEIYDLLKKD